MDSGSLDKGRVSLMEDKIARETTNFPSADWQNQDGGTNKPVVVAAKAHKKMASKESPRSSINSLNKFKLQIKKLSHRNGSPLSLIPRQKGDSYLLRKIKQLQEESGMTTTLDETLGTANPHYCRVLREKIAAKQAAAKAMEARKAAMVEASWCRILKAARIQSKEAEELLFKAEKNLAEALEAATAKGVMMSIDYPLKQCVIETSSAKGKTSTHTVKASFETAFEVDRQVSAAVKTAFVRLAANCPSSLNKDEYISLLRKISEKPATHESNQDLSDVTSEFESEGGLKFELVSEDISFSSQSMNQMDVETKLMRSGRSQSPQKYDKERLVDIMFGRLKCLKEEELASLATIVATCGLNAALAEMENQQQNQSSCASSNPRRMSTFGGLAGKVQSDVEFPSLDKCLIKHMTKLEREVNARKNDSKGGQGNLVTSNQSNITNLASSEIKIDKGLGSILVKHSSKLEKEKAELKRKIGQISELDEKELGEERQTGKGGRVKQKVEEVPSLDKFLVKHVSRLDREVQEAKSRRNNGSVQGENRSSPCSTVECTETDSIDSNKNEAIETIGQTSELGQKESGQDKQLGKGGKVKQKAEEIPSLDKFLVKHVSRLEREVQEAKSRRNDGSAQNVSKKVPSVNQLEENQSSSCSTVECTEKENIDLNKNGAINKEQTEGSMELNVNKHVTAERMIGINQQGLGKGEGGLDHILVKHKSKLEREKMAAAQHHDDQTKHSISRREARERELQEAWGGMSLGNSIRPHVSRLEREKAAWMKAEEERKAAMRDQVLS